MSFSIANIQDIPKQDWDSFAYAHPSSFLWHTYDFIIGKNRWSNHSNESFAILDKDDQIVGIFPLHKICFKQYRFFRRSCLDNMGGWICKDDASIYVTVLLEEFKRRLNREKQRFANMNFATASLFYKEDPFFYRGFQAIQPVLVFWIFH
jgi:hypothetical protein